jgi:hypothetical protein
MSFIDAAVYTARLIDHRHHGELVVGLSGGADSEFVARCFYDLNIPFTPIIIDAGEINEEEASRAYKLCSDLNLSYYIIKTNSDELNHYYHNRINNNRSDGLNYSFEMMIVDKATEWRKIAVLGETHIYDPDPMKSIVRSFKFLPDLSKETRVIPFYYYTLELTYAEMCEVRENETSAEFKSRVRMTTYRPKQWPKHNAEVMTKFNECLVKLSPSALACDMGTPKDFIKEMEKYMYELQRPI